MRRKIDDDVGENHHSPLEFDDFRNSILKLFKKFAFHVNNN